jgi:hypothetical protein
MSRYNNMCVATLSAQWMTAIVVLAVMGCVLLIARECVEMVQLMLRILLVSIIVIAIRFGRLGSLGLETIDTFSYGTQHTLMLVLAAGCLSIDG